MTTRSRAFVLGALALLPSTSNCGRDSTSVTASAQGAQVYLRLDFDADKSPFEPAANSSAVLEADPLRSLTGHSLRVERLREGRSIGATVPLHIQGATGLRVAFAVRAQAMQAVTVNVFDERRQDNTTPASPARIFDDDWHLVNFAAEDFHYNADPPDKKIPLDTSFTNLFIHAQAGQPARLWVDKLVVYRGHDGQPPDAPDPVRAQTGADGSIELTWREPADNTFAVVYSVYRKNGSGGWEKLAETLRPEYRDSPPASSAGYSYRITAADYENNVSRPSSDVTGIAAAAATGGRGMVGRPSLWVTDRVHYAEHVRQVHARGADKVRPDVFLFAGDSLTAATLYTHVLGSWLARGLMVRRGVGTVTTEYGAANIDSYLADARPEFAVVMYGTNDQLDGLPVSASMRNLTRVVDACIEAGTVPILATIPPRGFERRDQGPRERFNRGLLELAWQKQVPVSYVFEEMMKHDLKEMLYDGVHLKPGGGNEAAGLALRQTMDQVYFALRDTSGRW